MLFLILQIGEDAYAIDAGQVKQVLPMVRYKRIPHAPEGIVGLLNFHGALLPLIDLAQMMLGRKSEPRMSARIIVVDYEKQSGERGCIGLLAEQVMETIRRDKADFTDPGVPAGVGASLYLGPITLDQGKVIQQIDVNRLMPADVAEQLLREPVSLSQ